MRRGFSAVTCTRDWEADAVLKGNRAGLVTSADDRPHLPVKWPGVPHGEFIGSNLFTGLEILFTHANSRAGPRSVRGPTAAWARNSRSRARDVGEPHLR